MNLSKSICDLMRDSSTVSVNGQHDDAASNRNVQENFPGTEDGMSVQTAMFRIVKCADNKEYHVQDLENKGRYFKARVLDPKGKVVNELLIDKLNGSVKFLR